MAKHSTASKDKAPKPLTIRPKKSNLIWVAREFRQTKPAEITGWTSHFGHYMRNRLGLSYSRTVRLLKIVLPATGLALVLLLLVWPNLSSNGDQFRLEPISDATLENAELRMVNPRFMSLDTKNRPFNISATAARQQEGGQNTVIFQGISADMTMDDETWLALMSSDGSFNRETNILMLSGQVNIFHDQGYEISTSQARIDLNTNTIIGDQPVSGNGPLGLFTGTGVDVDIEQGRLNLRGPARLVMYPQNETQQ